MEDLSISHFRELLSKHIREFKDHCTVWENLLSSETVPDEVNDEIRTTIGLTNLLMRQKMKQFGELIDDSEHNRGEKEITCLDLQGFWDMVYNEVEKIQKSFKKLEKCQKDNWVFIEEPVRKAEPKKKPGMTISTKVTAAAKERAVAARQRLAEAKLKMKAQLANNDVKVDVRSTTDKASVKLSDQISTPKAKEISNTEGVNLNSPRKQAQNKQTLRVIENTQSSSKKEKASQSEGLKAAKIMSGKKKNKENLSVPELNDPKFSPSTSSEKTSANKPANKKRSPKEIVPLQCLTRSAKKALLEKENALNN